MTISSGFLNPDVFIWLQTFLTPCVVVVTAFVAWRVHRVVLARRVAFDYIVDNELDQDWQDLNNNVKRNLVDRPDIDHWLQIAARWSTSTLTQSDLDLMNPIIRWLNRREFVAISLLNGSMHQKTYAELWGISLIQQWERVEPFVKALRTTKKGDDKLFCKFEKLANSSKFKTLSKWDSKYSMRVKQVENTD